ncbi:MAG TPA: glycosyltransferase [Fimbriiglobus sp.]|jgi:glycosyltransferase involved in cell wall biosynthesis
MDAGAVKLTVERLIEKYSGLPLIGAGGYFPPSVAESRVEIRYDGVAAGAVILAPGSHSFGTHVPLEPDARRVSVVWVNGDVETVWFDQPLAEITPPVPLPPPPRRGKAVRILAAAARAVKSVATGQVASKTRWQARLDRWDEAIARMRLKFRDREMDRRFPNRSAHRAYVEHTQITPRIQAAMAEAVTRFAFRPTFSILVPVYDVDPKWLQKAVESVRRQVYPHWELCLADDASTNPATIRHLHSLSNDPRIKITFRESNGHICAATNSAADLATGQFIALLDNDDELSPDALFHTANELQAHPDADVIYSDEDKMNEAGERYDPQFKPDWSPELLFSYNYVNHLTAIRRTVFDRAGRYRIGYEGSQDHDLLLRVTELTDRVRHVPRVLYHWRSLPSSTAAAAGVKRYVHVAGRKAVEGALRRRKISATLYMPEFAGKLGLPVLALDGPDEGPLVSIVVSGSEAEKHLTVAAVQKATDYRNYTFGSDGEFVLHLAAGVKPGSSRWLSRLVANLRVPGVGACGGLIRDEAGTILSAGLVHGMRDGTASVDAFRGTPADRVSYYFYAEVTRNVSAVSADCLLARRNDLGPIHPTLPGWAVDVCTRLREKGLRCVHVGGAELQRLHAGEENATVSRTATRRDPYYNPNLSDRHSFVPQIDSPVSLPSEATAPPVRVLVAAHNLNNPEGAPRYLSEIVLGLRGRGILEPAVLSPLGGAGAAVYDSAGVPVAVADSPWAWRFVDAKWNLREYETAQADLARRLAAVGPDVILANTLLTFPVVEAAAKLGIPSVWIIHESYAPDVLARAFSPFARSRCERAFRYATRVVPASHDTARLFAHWNARNNVRVLHNGLDPTPIDAYCQAVSRVEAKSAIGATRHKKTLIAVGTVCERKGQHALVQAAARLRKTRNDFEVFLVGARAGEPYADYTHRLVRRHGLEDVVRLIPEADAVPYFRAADVFVCTSFVETFSRSVMEALAFGLPIVSTACCGIAEQVVWNHNALPVGMNDSAGLADQLGLLLANDDLRTRMARHSRDVFDAHLSLNESLDRYADVIVAAARQGPRANRPWVAGHSPTQPLPRWAA